jgi:hypothetical protein
MRTLFRIPVLTAVLAGACVAFASGCYATSASVGVSAGAPPATYDAYYAERDGHVWIEGHWTWNGNQWVWAPGYWVAARPGYAWVDGYWYYDSYWRWRPGIWVTARPGYVYTRGYWGVRGGSRVWVRGSWVRSRPGYTYSRGRWIRRSGSPVYRHSPGTVRDHRTYRRSTTRDHRTYRGGSRVRRR